MKKQIKKPTANIKRIQKQITKFDLKIGTNAIGINFVVN